MYSKKKLWNLEERISQLESNISIDQISVMKLDLDRLKTHISSLRGLINRKLSGELPGVEPAGDPIDKYPQPEKFNDGMDNFRGLD